MLKYFLDNNLSKSLQIISRKQSEFRPGDSCINQLLSITHDIYIYIYIYIYMLKQNGIKHKLLCLLIDFLKTFQQRVVLNG